MLISMTGYGYGTATSGSVTAVAEIRSVNNRYHEVSMRLPKSLQNRELEVKELLKSRISRGKLSLAVSLQGSQQESLPITLDRTALRHYLALVQEVREVTGIEEELRLDHLLRFPDIFHVEEGEADDEAEWTLARTAIEDAITRITAMKVQEGGQLCDDLRSRVRLLDRHAAAVQALFEGRVEQELQRVTERVRQFLTEDKIDPLRLEQEVVMYAAKTDITEELVRLQSHTRFFLEALDAPSSEGRKLTFLLQEMNREANTISSKSYDTGIAHTVVEIKEELERIREQLQNVE